MPTISPCLWFDDDLEEAIAFYTSVFPDSEVRHLTRNTDAGTGEPGTVLAGEWTINGVTFKGINGGPEHASFTESVSFAIDCTDQDEVDRYWEALTADGGEESVCGWVKDRFGLSWQVVPVRLYELLSDPEPARAQAAAQAMLGMRKIVVAELEEAVAKASTVSDPGAA